MYTFRFYSLKHHYALVAEARKLTLTMPLSREFTSQSNARRRYASRIYRSANKDHKRKCSSHLDRLSTRNAHVLHRMIHEFRIS